MKLSEIYENAPILKQGALPIGDKFVISFGQLMFPAEVKDRHPVFQKPYLLIHQMDNYIPNDEFWAKSEIDRSPIFTLLLFRNFKFRLVPEIENHPEMLQHRGKHYKKCVYLCSTIHNNNKNK